MNKENCFKILERGNHTAVNKSNPDAVLELTCEKIELELYFLGIDGTVKSRTLRVYLPLNITDRKLPVVICVHYEMPEDDRVLYDYIKRGWAVTTPVKIPPGHLGNIVEDDFLFNMAVMDFARRLDFADTQRIILRGHSAGGFQALMLDAFYAGINSIYVISPIFNLSYVFKYIKQNNDLNIKYELQLNEEEKKDIHNYPVPGVKSVYDIALPTIKVLGIDDFESERWLRHSPLSHIGGINNPVLMVHSTADVMTPINMLAEKYAYKDTEDDMPDGYVCGLKVIISNEKMSRTMEELLPSDELEIHCIKPSDCSMKPVPMEFNPEKRFNLTVVDEGRIGKGCGHYKNNDNFFMLSEMDFLEYSMSKASCETDQMTFAKVKNLAQRYNGKLDIHCDLKRHKAACCHEIPGSLYSDRLDVLLNIMDYLGIDIKAARSLSPENDKLRCVECNSANLSLFLKLYYKLDEEDRFLDNDACLADAGFDPEPVGYLLKLTLIYLDKCGGFFTLL